MARILHLPNLHSPPSLLKTTHTHFHFTRNQHFRSLSRVSSLSLRAAGGPGHLPFSQSPRDPSFISFPIFSGSPRFSSPGGFFDRVFFGGKGASFRWNYASRGSVDCAVVGEEKGPEVAVVVLGWLGAKPKHLRRYVELYNARGIHAVTFVASVIDVLWIDFGKSLEERIEKLARELAAWLSAEGGRERVLMFHTFSNTGWLAYGAILDNLKGRRDLLDKVKGCVVDSGGDPNIDPKVWAAGFTTALLKKSSSATYPSAETSGGNNGSKIEEKEPLFFEALLLSGFKKFFSYLLNLPYVNQKLRKIISCLSNDQPPCPQLCLYSTGDRVIPFQAIESFIENQRNTGKTVLSFNFVSSPHVSHYLMFPGVYTAQLDNFLKECLSSVGKL